MTNQIKYWYLEIEYIDGIQNSQIKKYVGREAGSYAKIHRRRNNYFLKYKDADSALARFKAGLKADSYRSRGIVG